MNDTASSGNPEMTRGRLRDPFATFLQVHDNSGELSAVGPTAGDTARLRITATDRQHYRLSIAREHREVSP